MCRAETPAHPMASNHELKTPDLHLGQKVTFGPQWGRDFPYYLKCYARHLIKRFRKSSRGRPGPLSDHHKKMIRDCLQVFKEAHEFEVAGLSVRFGFNLDSTQFNACYLAGVKGAASPPHYTVQLLIRFKRDGKNLALIVGGPGVSATSVTPIEKIA